MKDILDGLTFKEMIIAASARIEANQQAINELNVFPVPDGDTGTNMSLTMLNARKELQSKEPKTLGEACDITASALLRGARGNSGVILSLLFRGFARSLKEKSTAGAVEVAAALSEGVTAAYKAVMKPTEGTILTVSRLAAAGASAVAEAGESLEATLDAALTSGKAALERTIEQNPVLKKAGVIDAGGKGYIIILEAMCAALKGDTDVLPTIGAAPEAPREKAVFSEFDTEDITYGYCTEFIVSRENKKDPDLLWSFLGNLGDSIVVVDDDEIIKVHVHNNCPGVVLTEALTYGSLLTVKIENMREQHTDTMAREKASAAPEKELGIVAVCAGEGLEQVFHELGVDAVVSGGQTMNPSTEDILREVERTPAKTVFVLPNNKNIILAANQCDALTDKNVIVVPTATVPQGISAMLAFDPEGDPQENASAMEEMSQGVHTLSVTYAARDSEFDGISMKEGDYLALLEGKLLTSDSSLERILPEICSTVAGFDPACVTVYYGEDVTEADAAVIADALAQAVPEAEVQSLPGGQPVYYYLISAE